ncbi:glutamine synthetase family protein [Methanobacterium sp.]|uniref:glutamine synthetase family protein n=1 Tax=Methanobacterium sp. TaxID=2164 RepID=UPI003C73F229
MVNKKSVIPSDIDFIRILWCDNANIIRAKSIYKNSSKDSNYYVGISEGQQGVPAVYDAVIEESGLSPIGEVQLKADLSSFTPIPYSPGHGRFMGSMMKNGKTWDYCPRGFLKRMIDEARKMGFSVKGAFENEFYLLNKTEEGICPADNTSFASTYSMDVNREIIDEMVKALILQGMEVQQCHAESGPGQQEITVKYDEALKACDNQIVFRETVRAIAGKYGLTASFLPKIFVDKAGSGCHLHLSLWREGKNILSDSKGEYGISKIGMQFIAGILRHLPALMAITTPITNSYRRIKPHYWSGAFQCWGIGNREASIRVIPEFDGKIKNFELKTVDASSNPYLVFGAVIAAGIHGIKQEMELEEPVQEDPGNILQGEDYKIKRLPSKLEKAIEEFEKDKIIRGAMGKNLSKAYIAVKKAELEVLKDLKLEEEVKLLLEKY